MYTTRKQQAFSKILLCSFRRKVHFPTCRIFESLQTSSFSFADVFEVANLRERMQFALDSERIWEFCESGNRPTVKKINA